MTNDMIGLAEAAQKLRLPYQNCHRLLLVGTLGGEKRNGRWYVRAQDVERVARERELGLGGPVGSTKEHQKQEGAMSRRTRRELEEENEDLRDDVADLEDELDEVCDELEDEDDSDEEWED